MRKYHVNQAFKVIRILHKSTSIPEVQIMHDTLFCCFLVVFYPVGKDTLLLDKLANDFTDLHLLDEVRNVINTMRHNHLVRVILESFSSLCII